MTPTMRSLMTLCEAFDPRFDPRFVAFDYKDNQYTTYARDMRMIDGLRYVYYEVPVFRGTGFDIQIRVFDDQMRMKVGAAGFDDQGGSWSVWVHDDYRRKGIATRMYDWAGEKLGKIVHPATNAQLGDGKAFWANRKSKASPS